MFRFLLPTIAVALFTAALPFADEKGPAWHEVLPANELLPLTKQIATALKKPIEALVEGRLDEDDRERAVKKARGLVLLLAAGAQTTKGEEMRGPIRNAALRLDQALRGGKFPAAQTILAALPEGKGFDKPVFAQAPLVEAPDRDDALAALMMQCRTRAAGGLGVEPKPKDNTQDGLEAMLKVVGDTGKGLKTDELARFALRLAILAEAIRSLPPPRPVGEKDPAKWLRWSTEMRTASLELADAARKTNVAAIRQAALKVSRSCNDCHKVFRDN